MNVSLPRGTRDYGPAEAVLLNTITGVIEETFKRFGFAPLETPAIELLETLNAKAYGEESEKELYKIEEGEEGLRYDFTVPLARYLAMNKDLPQPFKRYQIGSVWRKDEPQHMRSRELIQADVDIVGSLEPISDAESIAAVALSLEELGIREYTIFINSRKILDAILNLFSVPKQKHIDVVRALDKLQKLSNEEVLGIIKKSTDSKNAEELLNFVQETGENETMMEKMASKLPEAKDEINRIGEIIRLLKGYRINGKIEVDLSLARGLDYYTGGIWEFVVFDGKKRLPTIAAGGRYDSLIELYSKKSMPAVGTSIGIGRIFELVADGEPLKTYARLHIAYIKDENLGYAMRVANAMRAAGIYTSLELTKRNLAKQLEYANSMKIRYVAILGNKERESNKIKLRDMVSGEEEEVEIEAAVSKLKGE